VSVRSRAPSTYSRPLLQRGDGGGRDHAAIGDHADPADGKTRAQTIDHRNQDADIGGIAGPHLRADRPALRVDHHAQDHLHQVGPVILGIALGAERRTARAGETERRRIHENNRQLSEQVAPTLEQPFFDQVLDRARCERRRILLLLGRQFLAQPRHGPIQMMQRQFPGPGDLVVGHPLLAGTVRTRDHDPVQHGGEHGAFRRELERTAGKKIGDHGATAGFFP
jgi:hypothetical protein